MKQLHYHFIGIKGVGMTSLALCAQDKDIKVTGWDVNETFVTDAILKKRNIAWSTSTTIPDHPDLIITTGAHGGLNNPQVLVAKSMGIAVVTHAEALGMMMSGKTGISTCGVGGKTTTNAMIATLFDRALYHPSFENGVGNIPSLGVPGRFDNAGKFFIAEADEYAVSPGVDNRPRFTFQKPETIVITNIEHDHPDVYENLNSAKTVYREFFLKLPATGLLVAEIDNPNTRDVVFSLGSNINLITVGFSPRADWKINHTHVADELMFVDITLGPIQEKLTLRVPGNHNALNAVAAAAVANFYGISWEKIKKGLFDFIGTMRRFEFIKEVAGVKLYDDYAHHPLEIKAVIKAAKEWFPGKKIIIAFQAHTYSRTQALLPEFSQAFSLSDQVFITDIYASKREQPNSEISGEILSHKINKISHNSSYIGPKENIAREIAKVARLGDIVITMGAGDIFLTHPDIIKSLAQ